MKYKYILWSICALWSVEVVAQVQLSSTQLLKSEQSSAIIKKWQKGIDFLENENQNLPVVDKLELRGETDEWLLAQQEYMFRVSFNGRKSRKIQKMVVQQEVAARKLEQQLLLIELQSTKYQSIATLYYAQQLLAKIAEKKQVLLDKKTINERLLASGTVLDIGDVLKTQGEIEKIDQQAMLEEWKTHQAWIDLVQQPSSEYALIQDNWITPSKMKEVVEELATSRPLALEKQDNKIAKSKLAYDFEAAESHKIIDFVQTKYSGHPKLEFRDEWSIGIGINIPTKASERVKLNKAQLDILDEEFEYEMMLQEHQQEQKEIVRQFAYAHAYYTLLKTQITESQLEATWKQYKENVAVDPLMLLRIQENIYDQDIALLQAEQQLCIAYLLVLEYHANTAYLTTNFLSQSLEEIN